MSLITEDGTGLDDAVSYASVLQADLYHGVRRNPSWGAADDETKEAALIRATDFIDATFSNQFPGLPLTPTQGLAFPRDLEVALLVGVPTSLVKATAELALLVVNGTNLFQDDEVMVTKEVIGPIETTYALPTGEKFDYVRKLLKPLLVTVTTGGMMSVRLVRT